MDCQMPVMDGYTATREIRKNPAFEKLPILAMTANAMAGDREKVIEAGMWDHIAKPLNVGEMFTTIAKWIKPKAPNGGLATADTTKTIAASAMNTGASDTIGFNSSLPGIDVKVGMATTMGNAKLYTRLLMKFKEGQGDFATLFAAARADADPTATTRAAHTLKGTAGNIGAKGVQAAAAALEQACLQQSPSAEIDALLHKTLEALMPVIARLQDIGAEPVVAPDQPTLHTPADERVQATLQRLIQLLKDGDVEAAETLDALLDLAQGTPLAPKLKKVATTVADCDFDAALAALQQENLA